MFPPPPRTQDRLSHTNMPHTRRAQPTPVVQEQPRGRSVPRAPHPLLTSLASRPDSGDVSVLTHSEVDLLRRDAQVRRPLA